MHEHSGEPLRLFFADLDHLKEINDCFGHSEGDFAIRAAARLLHDGFSPDSVVGRVGGDEFLVLTPEQPSPGENVQPPLASIEQISRQANAFNAVSGKPYYVEISFGCREFVSGDGIRIGAELDMADQYLYADKQNRRASVRR